MSRISNLEYQMLIFGAATAFQRAATGCGFRAENQRKSKIENRKSYYAC